MIDFFDFGKLGIKLMEYWLHIKPKDIPVVLSDFRIMFERKLPYSEIDELNFCYLNSNESFGSMLIEMVIETEKIFYGKFYMHCLSFRNNDKVLLKINKPQNLKDIGADNYLKVNKDGRMVLGVEYFFHSLHEKEEFSSCDSICFDGFFALKKKKNIYGFMCKINRLNENWVFAEGNTYRIYKNANIENLYH